MALDFTQFQTEMQSVKDAITAKNFASARLLLATATMTFYAIPESMGSGERSTVFRKTLNDLPAIISAAEIAATSGGGTMLIPVQLGRAY